MTIPQGEPLVMTIRTFASEPPEATAPDACPPGALETPQAQNMLGELTGKMGETLNGKIETYRAAIETCGCPDWAAALTFGDFEVTREICNLSNRLLRGRLETLDGWVASERQAADAMKGSVR